VKGDDVSRRGPQILFWDIEETWYVKNDATVDDVARLIGGPIVVTLKTSERHFGVLTALANRRLVLGDLALPFRDVRWIYDVEPLDWWGGGSSPLLGYLLALCPDDEGGRERERPIYTEVEVSAILCAYQEIYRDRGERGRDTPDWFPDSYTLCYGDGGVGLDALVNMGMEEVLAARKEAQDRHDVNEARAYLGKPPLPPHLSR
jgi:hypothetical protein